jgi:hypothetical protein
MGKRILKTSQDHLKDPDFPFEDTGIMAYLRKIGREDILFNYDNLNSLEDLQNFCKYLLCQSVIGIGTEKESLTNVRFTTPMEKEHSLKAIKEGTTNLKAQDVSYNISELGFRLENPIDFIGKGVGVFGCSVTYGIGVPAEKTFCAQLQEKTGLPVYNFGIPGGGIQKITKAFVALNNQFKLKTAVFIMPSMHRFELIGLEDFDEIYTESYVPHFTPVNADRQAIYDLAYTHYDNLDFLDEFVKNMALIKANAKVHGTEVHFLTWDLALRDLAATYQIKDLLKYRIVHFLETSEKVQGLKVTDFARDGYHPGLRTQTSIANYLYYAIFKSKLEKDGLKPRSGKKII